MSFWLALAPKVSTFFSRARGEDAESGGVGVLEDDVGAARDLGEGLFLAGAHVIPVADVGGEDGDVRVDALGAALEGHEAGADRWQLGAADGADHAGRA